MNCPSCNASLPPNTRFCLNCGASIQSEISPSSRLDFSAYIAERTRYFTGREWLFEQIDAWLADEKAPRLFILTGEPGIGKSAIAARLACFSDGLDTSPSTAPRLQPGFLSTYHFCSAPNGAWISPKSFARSLSAQLSSRFPGFATGLAEQRHFSVNISVGSNLSQVIGVYINHYEAETAHAVFDDLVLQPLVAFANGSGDDQPILILVDSLDEALAFDGRFTIPHMLATCGNLPFNVRFLLTTRPEDRVLNLFRYWKPRILYADDPQNQQDIRKFIQVRLRETPALSVQAGDPMQQARLITDLSQRGGGNFLFVSKLLESAELGLMALDDPNTLPAGLPELYAAWLDRLTGGDRETWRKRYRPILALVSIAQEAPNIETLAVWSETRRQFVQDTLADLRQFFDPALDGTYRIYHQSVVDFLVASESGAYQIDLAEWHQRLAEYFLRAYGKNWAECQDAYVIRHLPYHLTQARQGAELQDLLGDFAWLLRKLRVTGEPQNLIEDYQHLQTLDAFTEEWRLIQGALRLSVHVLRSDAEQLAPQLMGRLLKFGGRNQTRLEGLLAQARNWNEHAWLCPLITCLESPGGALLRMLEGHTRGINAVAIVEVEGRVCALSGAKDNTVNLWDVNNGELLCTLEGHTKTVTAVAAAEIDGRVCALSGSQDNTLKLWDLSNGILLRTLEGHTNWVNAVAVVDVDGRACALSGSHDTTLKLWDLSTGMLMRTLDGHTHWVLAISGLRLDGRVYALSGSEDETLNLWDLHSGELLRSLKGHTGRVNAVVVIEMGRCVCALSGSSDTTLKLWDLNSGLLLRTLEGHTGSVLAVAIVEVGGRTYTLSGSDDRMIRLWDLSSGELLCTLEGHTDYVRAIARIDIDGRACFLSGSDDRTLRLWDILTMLNMDLNSDLILHTMGGHTDAVNAMAGMEMDGRACALSGSLDQTIKLWDLYTQVPIRTLKGHTGYVRAVAGVKLGGRVCALSGSSDRTLKLWDLSSGELLRTLDGHTRTVTAVAVVEVDERVYALSGSHDQTINLWELSSGMIMKTLVGHTDWVITVVVVEVEGRSCALSGSYDRTLRLWDLRSGALLRTLEGHTGEVYAVTVVEVEGRPCALSGSYDRTLKLWDLSSGALLRTMEGHTGGVTAIVGVEVGRYPHALSASQDKTLKLWDLSSETCLATFHAEAALGCCAAMLDGCTFVAGDDGGRLIFLRMEGERA